MAKKEWRLDSSAKALMASSVQEFLADRDPSISAVDWYKDNHERSYERRELYTQLMRILPSRITKDIAYKVAEEIKTSLAAREAEIAKTEATLKKHNEEDRKRNDELVKREREMEEKLRGKEAALALGEAEMARMKAQAQAEMTIYRSPEFHRRGGFMMTPWGPMGFGGY